MQPHSWLNILSNGIEHGLDFLQVIMLHFKAISINNIKFLSKFGNCFNGFLIDF